MPLNFFKPNKSKTGSFASFGFNSKEQVAYLSVTKQVGDMNHKPFAGSKQKTSVQFSMVEIGALLNVLEKKIKFNTVHKSESGSRIINFEPYFTEVVSGGLDENDTEKKKEFKGFSFSTTIQGSNQNFRSAFNPNEARILKSWLEFVLEHCFSAIYSEDKKQAQEFKKPKEEAVANEGDL